MGKEGTGGTPPRRRDGPTGPAPSGKWDGRDRRRCVPWCGVHHGRRDRGSMKGKGRDGRNSAAEQFRSHRSRTVREVGREG